MNVEPVEEEVLDGGPEPERHVVLSVAHRLLSRRRRGLSRLTLNHSFAFMSGHVRSLELGNVVIFVQLIFSPPLPVNQLYKNPNIA